MENSASSTYEIIDRIPVEFKIRLWEDDQIKKQFIITAWREPKFAEANSNNKDMIRKAKVSRQTAQNVFRNN